MIYKTFDKFKLLALINVLIIACIFIDFYFPVEHIVTKKFDCFESDAVILRSKRSQSYGINNYLGCKNGNSYFITKLPEFESEFKKNDEFKLGETYFFNKIKTISIKREDITYVVDISFLHYPINKSIYLFALVISLLTIFYKKVDLSFYFQLLHF